MHANLFLITYDELTLVNAILSLLLVMPCFLLMMRYMPNTAMPPRKENTQAMASIVAVVPDAGRKQNKQMISKQQTNPRKKNQIAGKNTNS
jgi:hypothetical protein